MPANEEMPMSGTIALSVPVNLAFRDPVGALIHRVCETLEEQGKARPGTASQVLSAFNEAFNNLAIHGRRRSPAVGNCEVEVELSTERLTMRIRDTGAGFDPVASTRPDPRVGEPGEGGYGLHIMRSYMTEVSYMLGVDGEANVLTMVRDLEPKQER